MSDNDNGEKASGPTQLNELLERLRTIATGALASIERRAREEPHVKQQPPGRVFWEGYLQAVEDVTAFVVAEKPLGLTVVSGETGHQDDG